MIRLGAPLALGLALAVGVSLGAGSAAAQDVLVVTSAVGGPHPALGEASAALDELAVAAGWSLRVADDPAALHALDDVDAVVFLLTDGVILDAAARDSLEAFVRGGGGFVGVHSAASTEPSWPFYEELVGARPSRLVSDVEGTVLAIDRAHPATAEVPLQWSRADSFYDFDPSPRDRAHVVATVDERTYPGGAMGFDHPVAWCREVDAGRSFYTALGAGGWASPELRAHVAGAVAWAAGQVEGDCAATLDAAFARVVLEADVRQPMGMDVAADGRVVFVERLGRVRVYDPARGFAITAGNLDVFGAYEMGLLGVALDPGFVDNGWVYLMYSPSGESVHRISRFTLTDDALDLGSEQVLLRIPTQRERCCHSAGGMELDDAGNLYVSIGNNTNPFESQGFAEADERPGRAHWDAQRTSGNTDDLRGKVLRIHPEPDGTYTIPDGNLFPGGVGGRPEIYVMGLKNALRIAFDPETGWLYVGDVGPDSHVDLPQRGPRGYDEINQVRAAANLGWPYCLGPNLPYVDFDFESSSSGATHDCARLINDSPNNTGARELPPAIGAWIYYPYARSDEFPELHTDETHYRTAMAGPTYHWDSGPRAPGALPRFYDDSVFVYDWSRHSVHAVRTGADGEVVQIQRFLASHPIRRPMQLRFGPGGRLFMLEYGSGWEDNPDAQLVRVDYVRRVVTPRAVARADRTSGAVPLTVQLSAADSADPNGDPLSFAWDFDGDGVADSTDVETRVTFDEPGPRVVTLRVRDPDGNEGLAVVRVVAGNHAPTIRFVTPVNEGTYVDDEFVYFRVEVDDVEDGSSDNCDVCEAIEVESALGHDTHAHPLATTRGCEGAIRVTAEHGDGENLFFVLTARYTDRGADRAPALSAQATIALRPQHLEAELAPIREGLEAAPTTDGGPGFRLTGGTDGSHFGFEALNLTNVFRGRVRVSSDGVAGRFEVRQGAVDGRLIGEAAIDAGGGWDDWRTVAFDLSPSDATEPLFFVLRGEGPRLFDVGWIELEGAGVSEPRPIQLPRHGTCDVEGETFEPRGGGCGCRVAGSSPGGGGLLLIVALGLLGRRRRQ